MKKITHLFLAASLVLCMLLAFPFSVCAAGATAQDGLEISILTDKSEYAVNEKIQVTVNVRNTNSDKAEGIDVETLLPEGLVLKTGSLKATEIEIEAGKTYSASLTAEPSDKLKKELENANNSNSNKEDQKEVESPNTSDQSGIGFLVLLLLACGVGVILTVKNKKAAKMLSLFLCTAMLFTMTPVNALAVKSRETISAAHTIKIAEKQFTLKLNVSYTKETISDCTVTFETNGGSAVENQIVKEGETIAVPAVPEKEGFVFVGWYADADFTAAFDFNKPVTTSCTVFARWIDASDKTDTDGDGLYDSLEKIYGSDPSVSDSDNDGLDDYVEIAVLGYDHNSVDSDKNGVADGDEDIDCDGLTNKEESSLGTDCCLKDTDGDALADKDEIDTYKTDPLNADTDQDGASDGWEITNSFDPLTYDETFSVEVKSEETVASSTVAASAAITANGLKASSLKVESVSEDDIPMLSHHIPGYLGQAYEFTADGNVTSAVITFEYDTALGTVSDEFQPRIYYYNEESMTLEELENQTVIDGKVSVTVSHFSRYILLNKVEFDKVWESEIKPPLSSGETDAEPTLDIMFVIDYSGSMSTNDPYHLFMDVSEEFVNKLRDGKDKAGAVKFIRKATLLSGLTTNKESVISSIRSIVYDDGYGVNSGTDGSAGIKMGLDELQTSVSGYKYIVFITDGEDNGYSYSYDSLIETANKNAVTIYAIGMGTANESTLKNISSKTGGKYYHATSGVSIDGIVNLDDVFKDIEAETIDLTKDSNNDKIPDYYNDLIKAGTLRLSNGSDQFRNINFNVDANGKKSNDYDGDGIVNGDELKIVHSGSTTYIEMETDPTNDDTDGDGILDNDDPEPSIYTITDRTLAIIEGLSYTNLSAYVGKTVKTAVNGGVSIKNVSDEDLKLIENAKIIQANDSADTFWGDFFDKGLGCVTLKITRPGKDTAVIFALRGTELDDDLLHDASADLKLGVGWDCVQSRKAYNIYREIANNNKNCDIYITGHSLGCRLALDVLYKVHNANEGGFFTAGANIPTPVHTATFNGLGYNSIVYVTLENDILSEYDDKLTNYYYIKDLVGDSLGASLSDPPFGVGPALLFTRPGNDVDLFCMDINGNLREQPSLANIKYHGIKYFHDDYQLLYTSSHDFSYWVD